MSFSIRMKILSTLKVLADHVPGLGILLSKWLSSIITDKHTGKVDCICRRRVLGFKTNTGKDSLLKWFQETLSLKITQHCKPLSFLDVWMCLYMLYINIKVFCKRNTCICFSILGPVIEYLPSWQKVYFYLWSAWDWCKSNSCGQSCTI